ncbi:MAG: hypothetical protein WKG01_01065 [Kofleriaceae bacterium]
MLRALTIIALALSRLAYADDVVAEAEFREGRRLLQANQLDEACAALGRSQALDPRSGTLLNLGDCLARRGLTASAHASFVEAGVRARFAGDERRAAEAERRASVLVPELARLTVMVSGVVEGTLITRNGAPVEWNTAIPVDPGEYTIAVRAPGHRGYTHTQTIAARQQALVVVEPRVPAVASGSPPPPSPPPPRARSLGLGLLVGAGVQRENVVAGARISGAVAVPGGTLRAIGMLSFSQYPDDSADLTLRTRTYSFGCSADYVWQPHVRVGIGAGIGIGVDYDVVNRHDPMRQNDLGAFWALRASPAILRLRGGAVEVGLHVQVQIAGDELITNGIGAVDWYLW